MNKWGKRIGIISLVPIVLILLISILLYLPFVQDMVVKTASGYASKATGMQIGIEQLRLKFPLTLKIRKAQVLSATDTLLDINRFDVEIGLWPLLKREVQIRKIDINQLNVNSKDLIDGLCIKGRIEELYTHTDSIDLKDETARFKEVRLSNAAITLLMEETEEEQDTTSSSIGWQLGVDRINISQVALAIQLAKDSLRFATYIDNSELKNGWIDLKNSTYQTSLFSLSRTSIAYDKGFDAPLPGFDPNHVQIDSLNLQLDSLSYTPRDIKGVIKEWTARERSGLNIQSIKGRIDSDEKNIRIPHFGIQTDFSSIVANAEIPWSSIGKPASGKMEIRLDGQLGKRDLFCFLSPLPEDFKRAFPDQPSRLSAVVTGNIDQLSVDKMEGQIPQLLTLNTSGRILSVTDSVKRSGELEILMTTEKTELPLAFLSPTERENFLFPPLSLKGELSLYDQLAKMKISLSESDGKIQLVGSYDLKQLKYDFALEADSIEPVHFMPNDSLYWVEAKVKAEGQGTDLYAKSTFANIDGKIDRIRYGETSLSDITIKGELQKNELQLNMVSGYPLAEMELSLNANISKEKIYSMLAADIRNLDLKGLHLLDMPLSTSFQLFAEAESNMKLNHALDVSLGNWELKSDKGAARPKLLTLHVNTDKDTSLVSFHVGDLDLTMNSSQPLENLGQTFATIGQQIQYQLKKDSTLSFESLRPLLPQVKMKLKAQRDNPLFHLLQTQDISFDQLQLTASSSPERGLVFNSGMTGLMQDTTRIDSIRFVVEQDTSGLIYKGSVIKKKFRKQLPFTASIGGHIGNREGNLLLNFVNDQGESGFHLGARVEKVDKGFDLHFYPEEATLAFQQFNINKDNFIHYESLKNITADVTISGKDYTSIRLYTLPSDLDMNGINLELNQLDLGYLSQKFNNLPALGGKVNTSVQYLPSDTSFMVIAETHIDTLVYEKGPVGELLMNAVYLPISKDEHQIDIHLFRNEEEISSVTAFYQSGLKDYIEGQLSIIDLPLPMLDPFIPDDMAQFTGRLQGEVNVVGNPMAPETNGFIRMDSAQTFITATGSSLRFDTASVLIKKNILYFDQYDIYAFGNNPFILDGTINGNNLSAIRADLTMKAKNMEVLNVKRTHKNIVYGKLFANLNSRLKGPLTALKMRGDLQLLGGTNVTYVLQDSPLTAQDRLSSLVSFTDFSDTLFMHKHKPEMPLPIKGLDMLMTIHVDQSVRLNADITPDQSSRVELEGGGDLSFQYTPQGDMILNGKYSLSGGIIKYAMPIIPLKEFNIQDGSFISWDGPVMDPYLHLTATERIRASVSKNEQSSRMTNFDVGVSLKDRLENLKFQFILNAPEDQTMQQELAKMGESERSQIAVTMLVTGMYLNLNDMESLTSGSKGLDMGDALNNFLQTEIVNIAGSALKTVDITLGMEQYDQEDGGKGQRTDYSFRFAKRFYNDRISIILGGRVSTGQNTNNGQAQPFIDNASIEYRLDNSGTRYIKLFHDKNYESLLEGEITETGLGVVLRKKMLHLRELFIFKKNKNKAIKENEKKK